jgi:hypothetical protein
MVFQELRQTRIYMVNHAAIKENFQIRNSVTAELTRIERTRGFLDAAKFSEDWIAGMQKHALVLEAQYKRHKLLVEKRLVREVGTGPTDPTKYYQPLL